MGYSCTNAALQTLRAVKEMYGADLGASNEVRLGGRLVFFERGDEQSDGAIVGRVFDVKGGSVGRFRINADGSVGAIPGLPKRCYGSVEAFARSPHFRSCVAVI